MCPHSSAVRLRPQMWESHSGACTHMCACTAPPHRCALPPLSAANPPSLTCGLGSSFFGSTATAPQLLPGLGKENPQRTPQAPHTFMPRAGGQTELVCAAWSHRQGLAAHHCCPERPPPVLSLFSGPEPGATSKCRLDFLRAPGAALSLLFPGYCPSPSMYPPCWGAVGFVALTTV